MRGRDGLLARLEAGHVPDVLIVGGGINGVGVFRDLAAQGIASLLVEAGDFSSGTSAAPSRLIHGGLRYLETGEAALVRESLLERNLLLKNARHVVHPQPVWIPLQSWLGGSLGAVARFLRLTRTPGRKGAVPVAIGLNLYDLFGRVERSMPNHRMLSAARARSEMPVLAPDVRAVAEFHDARISHPERLVLELVADAEADCPDAMALPYLAAGRQAGGQIALHDGLTGRTFHISPKIVVNASGAWVDRVQADLGMPGRLIGGTRGTHLVIRNKGLADGLGGRMLYFETHDFRACLALPLDADHVYVGTTDIRTDDPDDRDYSEAEVEYIFKVLRPVLPGIKWRREDVVFVMAGIRPLPYQDDKVKASGAISRDHRIEHMPPAAGRPFETLVLVGGKWTTYRAFAEQVTDRVLGHLGASRRRRTDRLEIGGARGFPTTAAELAGWIAQSAGETGISVARFTVLAGRYGSHAKDFAEAERADPRRFVSLDAYTPAEIARLCRTERVSRLDDVIMRRTLMAFEGLVSLAVLDEVAEVVAETLGWSADQRRAAVNETADMLNRKHQVAA